MSNKNEVFEYLIDQLRQQVNSNQCEDLEHEVQSLKNQLHDASAQIKELHLALVKATGDAEAYKLIRKGGCISEGQSYVVGEHAPGATVNCRCTSTPVQPEQSGCRKDDAQECEHDWYFYDIDTSMMCKKCGLKSPGRQKGCPHSFYYVVTDGSAPFGTKVCKTCGEYF